MNEMVPDYWRVLVTTLLNVIDGFIMIFQVVYYAFNRDSYPLYWFTLAISFFMTMIVLFMPESPKFLYARNNFEQSRKCLIKIAKINGIRQLDQMKIKNL